MAYLKKIAACAMAIVISMSAVLTSGCGKKTKGSNEIVSADSVWYNTEKHVLDLGHDPEQFDYLYTQPLGEVGDYLALESTAFFLTPEGVNMLSLNFVDYYADYVDIFDKNGNHVNSIDIVGLLSNSSIVDDYIARKNEAEADDEETAEDSDAEETDDVSDALSSFFSGGVCIVDDKIKATVSFAGFGDISKIDYTVFIDPVTSEITYELNGIEARDDGSNEGVVSIGDYRIEKIAMHEMNSDFYSYILNIYDNSGLANSIDLSEKLPEEVVFFIDTIIAVDDDTVLLKYYPEFGPSGFIILNILTGEAEVDDDGEYQWLDNYYLHDTAYFEGIGNVILDDEGIKSIDYENKTLAEVFSFDSCIINRGDISTLKLMTYTEEEIVFVGSVFRGTMFNDAIDAPQLIVLSKAESNPNAGKTILTAATIGNIDYAMSEAICVFNETDPNYFIRFDYRYKADNHIDMSSFDYMDEEAYRNAYDEAAIELSNQLTIDLMAGDGPDIIFDTASLSQLNNEDYLLDLSDRINTDGLFSNVIEAARTGDKLYQIPLTFSVTGIAVLNENIEPGQTGFTFDQYDRFVDTVCYGKNPLAMDQTEFFGMCMDAMQDQFITDGRTVDYDNEAFLALAEYTNDNIFPPIVVEDEYGFVQLGNEDPILADGAIRIDAVSFDKYLALLGNHTDEATILGFPSIDGRGPMLSVGCSVAISAQTAEEDACWAFIETLLSSEVQGYYAQSTKGSPILKSAFESFARDVIDDYNRALSDSYRYMSAEAIQLHGPHMTELDYSVIDDYESMIASCSSISTTDTAITVILREEMPAYFSGQKTLDEVILIIENRVQLFLDERG